MNKNRSKTIILLSLATILGAVFFYPSTTLAQNNDVIEPPIPQLQLEPAELPPEQFFRAEVVSVEKPENIGAIFQRVEIKLLTGDDSAKIIKIDHGATTTIREDEMVKVGEEVVVIAIPTFDGGIDYFIVDKYRLPAIFWIFAIFFAAIIYFGGKKGLGALFGLVISIAVIIKFILPQILSGHSPMGITLLGIVLILPVSIYLAHGFSKRTSVALLSSAITIGIASIVSIIFVNFAKLSGLGSEEAFYLQIGQYGEINFQGLLLAGILIGALGVLDDVSTAQSAVVDELQKANPNLSTKELYKRGISVGREHTSSMVNTLVLAYAGTALPLLLLFTVNENVPLWVNLNSNLIAEEIIRSLVGSSALVLAVPITTWFASKLLKK